MRFQNASANLRTRLSLLGITSKQLDAVGFMHTLWPGSWQHLDKKDIRVFLISKRFAVDDEVSLCCAICLLRPRPSFFFF